MGDTACDEPDVWRGERPRCPVPLYRGNYRDGTSARPGSDEGRAGEPRNPPAPATVIGGPSVPANAGRGRTHTPSLFTWERTAWSDKLAALAVLDDHATLLDLNNLPGPDAIADRDGLFADHRQRMRGIPEHPDQHRTGLGLDVRARPECEGVSKFFRVTHQRSTQH